MAKFNREEYIRDKAKDLSMNVLDLIKSVTTGDMSKLAESTQKILYDLLDMAIDKEVSTWEDAERQAKKADLKKIGLYIDTK